MHGFEPSHEDFAVPALGDLLPSRSTIAERLPKEDSPDGLGQDLRGRALGCMAEALRLNQQPEAARAALAMQTMLCEAERELPAK